MFAFLALRVASAGDWYSAKGRDIVNSAGKVVRLSGLNWFGYDTTNEIFHGLWAQNIHTLVKQVAERGFNCFRVPVSAKLLHDWKAEKAKTDWPNNPDVNKELVGLSNLQVFEIFMADLKKYRLKMFIDIHGLKDDSYSLPLWYDSEHPAEYLVSALEWFANRYKSDDTVIGLDIKNEPAGACNAGGGTALWDDSTRPDNWKHFVEQTVPRLLAVNPNLLMFVEGIECWEGAWGWKGGNFVGYSYFPLNLGKYTNKLVFAPHEYGPSVYKAQWWFKPGFNYNTLYEDHWYGMWMYLWERNIGPILIGEWGGKATGDDLTWMKAMVQLITNYSLSQTFWCLNPNSGDTGGLLQKDWLTWDETKYALIKPVLVKT
jgi:hypothetical protein